MTSAAFARAGSRKIATGLSTQSELLPSAWRVELPSKPQSGQLVERREASNSSTLVLPAQVGHGLVAVEPDVFELELLHQLTSSSSLEND